MAGQIPSNRGEEARTVESALVARSVAGDADAFRQIYDSHATRLYNLACRMTGSTAEAEDLLQDVFIQAYRKLASYKGDAALGTWLYRLAMNLILDHVRSKHGKMDRATVALNDERGEAVMPARGGRLGDAVVDRLDLERAVERLPDSYKAAFLLHDVEGFEHREVGEMLGIAEGTSKSLVHKARLRIRAFLSAREPVR